MSHEHDLVSIEKVIRRAREQKAKATAIVCRHALKRLGGFALVPWQLVRQGQANVIGAKAVFLSSKAPGTIRQ
jgi:hypothetical protein